jgi:membrane-bound lytic murein transglycosylase F
MSGNRCAKRAVSLVVYAVFLYGVVLILGSCRVEERSFEDDPFEKGYLNAVVSYGPISYFIYRGTPMGYEYELLERLSRHLDLPVNLEVARDIDRMVYRLMEGEVDIIAHRLTVTRSRQRYLDFTSPLHTTRQVLVQPLPDNWLSLKRHEIEALLIQTPVELAGKTVHLRKGSTYIDRIQNLSDEIGSSIHIVVAPGHLVTEDLIRMVSEGSVPLTVADENIARTLHARYRNIDISVPVGVEQQVAWAVRRGSDALLKELNDWLAEERGTVDYHVLYRKYFEDSRSFLSRVTSTYFPIYGGKISPYDDLLREQASRLDWDWRVLAAQMYQESRFQPHARSWAGAMGLMQLMSATAREFGAEDPYHPEQNIRAAVAYLEWLDRYWAAEIPDPEERQKFVLGSYNIGPGHVQDARNLAVKYGEDPSVWDNAVERFIEKKAYPEGYNDEVVRFGYARGDEATEYVRRILELAKHYARFAE